MICKQDRQAGEHPSGLERMRRDDRCGLAVGPDWRGSAYLFLALTELLASSMVHHTLQLRQPPLDAQCALSLKGIEQEGFSEEGTLCWKFACNWLAWNHLMKQEGESLQPLSGIDGSMTHNWFADFIALWLIEMISIRMY